MVSLLRSIKSFRLFKVALKLYTKIVNCFFVCLFFSGPLLQGTIKSDSDLCTWSILKGRCKEFQKSNKHNLRATQKYMFFSRLLIFLF